MLQKVMQGDECDFVEGGGARNSGKESCNYCFGVHRHPSIVNGVVVETLYVGNELSFLRTFVRLLMDVNAMTALSLSLPKCSIQVRQGKKNYGMISSSVWIQHTNITDRRMDRAKTALTHSIAR